MRASQEWTFFCVVTPGLVELALKEWEEKKHALGVTDQVVSVSPAGLEVTLPWSMGIGLVHVLKIPTRVLVRLTTLTARDFPKLHTKAQKLPWTSWLAHPEPRWKISAHQCRLMHTGRLEETLTAALQKSLTHQPLSLRWQKEALAPETLYVRGVDDEWTISLDITGEALYKRGAQLIRGEAPLRETLAQACLTYMFDPPPETPVTLWDPLCGSGTFLFEALSAHVPTERMFSYKHSALNLGVAPWKAKAALSGFAIHAAIGSDIDRELVEKLTPVPGLTFKCEDFLNHPRTQLGPLWIIANPPYGERLKLSEGISAFADKLSQALSASGAQRILLLVPASWPELKIQGLRCQRRLSFSNGGLAVEARVWEIPHSI